MQFVNHVFGSAGWLNLSRMKALRKLNKEKTMTIENDLLQMKEQSRPKVANLNWLQLVPGGKDMTVVGGEVPAWMKHA